ncbi:hypothetical protein [Pseudomonas aeruginosa]|uniref:hypothetical protein n=1 Tax=Pseudomonas aeruginosa TaxID=287 RepID=UPI00053E6093|nr:hypothetical protein [Pseudomonas aeruginosa]
MIKHTPGPWHVGGPNKCTIYDKHGQRLANSFEGVMATQRTDSECEANARLCAAAPELLEALRIMVNACYPVSTEISDKGHEWCIAYLDQALPLARAAIAKATA